MLYIHYMMCSVLEARNFVPLLCDRVSTCVAPLLLPCSQWALWMRLLEPQISVKLAPERELLFNLSKRKCIH